MATIERLIHALHSRTASVVSAMRCAAPLFVMLTTAACTAGVDVRPDQMPRLTEVAMHQRRDAVALTPSGDHVVVHGRFDAETVPVDPSGPRLRFAAPVDARIADGVLTLSGTNVSPRQVALASLRAVHLSMFDPGTTRDVVLAFELGVGLAAGVGFFVLFWLYASGSLFHI